VHEAGLRLFPHPNLVRRFRRVYVTLDCKCWLAHELHFPTVVARRFTPIENRPGTPDETVEGTPSSRAMVIKPILA
jgi:hypothetical protein